MKNYPDVSELFKMKAEWRQQRTKQPVMVKLETAARLRQLSREVPKLTSAKKQIEKIRNAKVSK